MKKIVFLLSLFSWFGMYAQIPVTPTSHSLYVPIEVYISNVTEKYVSVDPTCFYYQVKIVNHTNRAVQCNFAGLGHLATKNAQESYKKQHYVWNTEFNYATAGFAGITLAAGIVSAVVIAGVKYGYKYPQEQVVRSFWKFTELGLKGALVGLGIMGIGNVLWYATDVSDVLQYDESVTVPAQKTVVHKDLYRQVEKTPGVQTGIVVLKNPLVRVWYTVSDMFGGAKYQIDFSL
jgi:hypothetical protein